MICPECGFDRAQGLQMAQEPAGTENKANLSIILDNCQECRGYFKEEVKLDTK